MTRKVAIPGAEFLNMLLFFIKNKNRNESICGKSNDEQSYFQDLIIKPTIRKIAEDDQQINKSIITEG
ncbi:MAG: hypothetical protein HC808_17405 [Candidatus Competibacteraceae bacterium]|nr:hypothetical protein [Candidatus Competibacteraceae bacterium]